MKNSINHSRFLKIMIAIVSMQFTMGILNAQKIIKCCRITFENSDVKLKGEITVLTDTSIQFRYLDDLDKNQPNKTLKIPVNTIKKVKCEYRKKRIIGAGILIGMGTGIVVGSIIGNTSYQPVQEPLLGTIVNPVGQATAMLVGGIIGTLSGGFIGGLIGAFTGTHTIRDTKIIIYIEGNIETYQQNISTLKMFLVTNK